MLKDQLLEACAVPEELLSAPSAPQKPGGLPERWALGERTSPRIAMLVAVVVLVYGDALLNQFTLDDGLYIMRNPQVTHVSLRELFAPNKITNVFRPFTFATLALELGAGCSAPARVSPLFNILLHAGVTLLALPAVAGVPRAVTPRKGCGARCRLLICRAPHSHRSRRQRRGPPRTACRRIPAGGVAPPLARSRDSCAALFCARLALQGISRGVFGAVAHR